MDITTVRGGRSYLAREELSAVLSPALLIVGSLDLQVLESNRKAYQELKCEKHMEILDGSTHLFEEPGKLKEVAKLFASAVFAGISSMISCAA